MASEGMDVIAPRELIIPILDRAPQDGPKMSGALWMSGAKLYFTTTAGTEELINSA